MTNFSIAVQCLLGSLMEDLPFELRANSKSRSLQFHVAQTATSGYDWKSLVDFAQEARVLEFNSSTKSGRGLLLP